MKLGRIFGDAVGLREAASIVFALAALLPLLVTVLALHRSGALWSFEAEAMVLVALATAVIGFIVFRVMVDRVVRLAGSLVGAGEAVVRDADTALVPGIGRVTEIGQIGTAFARMLAAGYGRMVLTGSIGGLYTMPNTVQYAISKSGMIGL